MSKQRKAAQRKAAIKSGARIMNVKTIMLGEFDKTDTEMLSDIVYSYLSDEGIDPASFAFHIEVEYTEQGE